MRQITNTNPKVNLQVIQDPAQKKETPLKVWYGDLAQLPAQLDDDTLYFVKHEINGRALSE